MPISSRLYIRAIRNDRCFAKGIVVPRRCVVRASPQSKHDWWGCRLRIRDGSSTRDIISLIYVFGARRKRCDISAHLHVLNDVPAVAATRTAPARGSDAHAKQMRHPTSHRIASLQGQRQHDCFSTFTTAVVFQELKGKVPVTAGRDSPLRRERERVRERRGGG